MVKKGNIDTLVHLKQEMVGKTNTNGKTKAGKSNTGNKENTPLHVHNIGSAHIDKIIQYIEGGPQDEAAFKKAQKKARQKQKKDEEKRQREEEEEALRKAEEERLRKEQELADLQRIREEMALQKSLKKAKKKQQQQSVQQQSTEGKSKKKKGKDIKTEYKEVEQEPELFEQTIPAMVTIKRVIENNNSPPTVTITLKGSTPDQDKLLYTLVNGHDAPIISPPPKETKETKNNKQSGKQQQKESQTKTNDKQKKKKNGSSSNGSNVHSSNSTSKNDKEIIQTNEIKVQFAVDSNFRKDVAKLKELKAKEKNTKQTQPVSTTNNSNGKNKEMTCKKQKNTNSNSIQQQQQQQQQIKEKERDRDNDIIDIPSIKLPPGITITKVSAPLSNTKMQTSQTKDYHDVPVSKSGVIVVDTEKLIQQQTGKKKKKKGKKNAATITETNAPNVQNNSEPRVLIKSSSQHTDANASSSSGRMVTLKNPIFHPMQNKPLNPDNIPHMINMNEQATISHGENGMVTIRRPRPVGFMPANESSLAEYKAQQLAKEASNAAMTSNTPREHILTPWQMPDTSFSALTEDRKIIRPPSPKGIQWPRADLDNGKINTPSVLQGLPGIEITRVRTGSPVTETEYVEPPANVSIIRTGGLNEKLRFNGQQ